YWHGVEEMQPDELLRPLERRGEAVDAQARGVRRDDGIGAYQRFNLGQHAMLHAQVFDDCLDHQVDLVEAGVIELRRHSRADLLRRLLGQATGLDLPRQQSLQFLRATLELARG